MNETTQSKYAFNIVPITTKDYNAIVEFLLKFFIRDEPLNMAAELIKEKDAGSLKNYLKRILDYGEFPTTIIINRFDFCTNTTCNS